MHSHNIAILTPGDHHVVRDGDQGVVHSVRMAGELVRV